MVRLLPDGSEQAASSAAVGASPGAPSGGCVAPAGAAEIVAAPPRRQEGQLGDRRRSDPACGGDPVEELEQLQRATTSSGGGQEEDSCGSGLPALAAQRRPGTAFAAAGAPSRGDAQEEADLDTLEQRRKALAARMLRRRGSGGRSRPSLSHVDRRVQEIRVALGAHFEPGHPGGRSFAEAVSRKRGARGMAHHARSAPDLGGWTRSPPSAPAAAASEDSGAGGARQRRAPIDIATDPSPGSLLGVAVSGQQLLPREPEGVPSPAR